MSLTYSHFSGKFLLWLLFNPKWKLIKKILELHVSLHCDKQWRFFLLLHLNKMLYRGFDIKYKNGQIPAKMWKTKKHWHLFTYYTPYTPSVWSISICICVRVCVQAPCRLTDSWSNYSSTVAVTLCATSQAEPSHPSTDEPQHWG